jgi:hypothetical protein
MTTSDTQTPKRAKRPISGEGTWQRNYAPMLERNARALTRDKARKAVATLRGLGYDVQLTKTTDAAPDVDAVLN